MRHRPVWDRIYKIASRSKESNLPRIILWIPTNMGMCPISLHFNKITFSNLLIRRLSTSITWRRTYFLLQRHTECLSSMPEVLQHELHQRNEMLQRLLRMQALHENRSMRHHGNNSSLIGSIEETGEPNTRRSNNTTSELTKFRFNLFFQLNIFMWFIVIYVVHCE